MSEAQRLAAWNDYVPVHLLPRLFGYELMMAPYAIAHMKIGLKLHETRYRFGSEERVRVYLTNALEPSHEVQPQLEALAPALAHEAQAVSKVKSAERHLVILGNPPYSGISDNNDAWIESLIAIYKKEPNGGPLQERKHWLNDDYVKFVRFAHWNIARAGFGGTSFITNHGWLDNPTFRGMRAALMRDFDEIYVLDLHGSSKKEEGAPDGGDDKNVFDIQQGVAILLFVRNPNHVANATSARVFHAEIWGLRDAKYDWLRQTGFNDVRWQLLSPSLPLLLFRPEIEGPREEYEQGWRVTDIFPINSTGILTARDHFAVDFERKVLEARICDFLDPSHDDTTVRALHFGTAVGKYPAGDSSEWKMANARKVLQGKFFDNALIQLCVYRPFDIRYIAYHPQIVWRQRTEVMQNFLAGKNLGMTICRQLAGNDTWQHILATKTITDDCYVSNKTKERGYVFPLYIYPDGEKRSLFDEPISKRKSNLAQTFLSALQKKLDITTAPETIFHYIYATLHSPIYRSRYAEFLKIDFPRIPLPGSLPLFQALAALGGELVALHLLESPKVNDFITHFVGSGDNSISKKLTYRDGAVWINASQRFEGVPEAVWNFHIGGYQVCEKWLKDRKGRTLSADDIAHYQRVVVALNKTLCLMAEIDRVIEIHGGWPGAFQAVNAGENPAA